LTRWRHRVHEVDAATIDRRLGMLGIGTVLIAIGAWIAIAPVVAIVVGRALKAADPYSGYELVEPAVARPAHQPRPRPIVVTGGGGIVGPPARPAIAQ
jgi:hypothetical protein